MHHAIYSGRKRIYFVHAFIMFILIHKTNTVAGIKYTKNTYLEKKLAHN